MKTVISNTLGLAILFAVSSFSTVAKADRDLGPVVDKCRAVSGVAIKEGEEFYDELYGHGHPRDPVLQDATEQYLGAMRHFNKHVKKFSSVEELKGAFEEVRSKYRSMKSTLDNSILARYPKILKRFGDLRAPWAELEEIVDRV